MKRAAALVLATAAMGAVACDGEVTVINGAGGAGASTTTSVGTGGDCASFDDAPGATAVTVNIVNESGITMYLPAVCGAFRPSIEPVDGPDGTQYDVFADPCLSTCGDLRQEEPMVCAAGACAETVVAVAPGQIWTTVWDGTGLRPTTMPDACWYDPAQSWGDCSQRVAAPMGSYAVAVEAFMGCTNGGVEPCSCDAAGLCYGSVDGAMGYHEPVAIAVPTDASVDVVFEVCAFGCAEPGG